MKPIPEKIKKGLENYLINISDGEITSVDIDEEITKKKITYVSTPFTEYRRKLTIWLNIDWDKVSFKPKYKLYGSPQHQYSQYLIKRYSPHINLFFEMTNHRDLKGTFEMGLLNLNSLPT